MGVAETVRDSEMLLEQMTEEPKAVLEALDRAERKRMVSDLYVLTSEAAKVQSEADLMYVANAVWRLVEGSPALAALLLPPDAYATQARKRRKRKINMSHHEAAQRESQYARDRAAQIRNRMIECHQKLAQVLQGLPQKGEQR